MTGLDVLRLVVRLLILAWVWIAYTDGLSDALYQAGGGIMIIWLMVRWVEKGVRRG